MAALWQIIWQLEVPVLAGSDPMCVLIAAIQLRTPPDIDWPGSMATIGTVKG